MLLKIRSLYSLFRIAVKGAEGDFTSGSVNRAAFLLSVPAMLELGMESLFILADLLFISTLGEGAITIAGIVSSVMILFHAVAIGLGIAATALIARRTGEGDPRAAGQAAVQVIYLGLASALLFSVLSVGLHDSILRLAGASGELAEAGSLYAKIMFGSVLFMIMRVLMNGIFRGAGDAAMAMRTLLLSNTLNVVLCAVLIFGPGPLPAFGLAGAGMAAGIANFTGVMYQLWYFRKGKKIRVTGAWAIVPGVVKKLGRLAVAGTAQYLVPASGRFLMIIIVSGLGESVLAGYIIANRVILLTVLPAWGIANAAGVLTGQNLGAGKPARAEQSVWKTGVFNMCFLGLIALALLFFADPVAGVFTRDPVVREYASLYLRYMAVAYFFFGYTMVISRSLNAAGSVRVVTWLYMLTFYVTQLPLAYLLAIALDWGPQGIFCGIVISEIVLTLCCVTVFRAGKWKQVKL